MVVDQGDGGQEAEGAQEGVEGAEALPPGQGKAGAEAAHREEQVEVDQAREHRHVGGVEEGQHDGEQEAEKEGKEGVGQGLLPLQGRGTGGETQFFPDGGHLGVPAHPAPQPDQGVEYRQQGQEQCHPLCTGVEARPKGHGSRHGQEVGQSALHQRPSGPGKGQGGDPKLCPEQGKEREGHKHPQPFRLKAEIAVGEYKAPKTGGPEQGNGAQQIAQQQVGGHAHQPSRESAAQGLCSVVEQHGDPSFQRPKASLIFFTYRRET